VAPECRLSLCISSALTGTRTPLLPAPEQGTAADQGNAALQRNLAVSIWDAETPKRSHTGLSFQGECWILKECNFFSSVNAKLLLTT